MSLARRSITWRITLLFTLSATIVLLALGLLVGSSVERHFAEQDRGQLAGKLELVAHVLQRTASAGDLAELPARLEEALVGHHDIAMRVGDDGGRTLYATPGVDLPAVTAAMPRDRLRHWSEGDRRWHLLAADLPTGLPGAPALRVLVAIDGTHHEHFLVSFRRTLWLFVAIAAALTGLLGWWAVRRGLAPLRAMRDEAAGVTASHLDRRLRADTAPLELAELAQTLNDMLQRLQDAFRRLTDFSSDLAHELRTPVNNLLTGTQVALGRARTVEEYRDVLASNIEEYERLARMIADMLFLAQADNGLVVPRREAVDLAKQATDLLEFFEPLSADKQLAVQCVGQATVSGDTLMLRRALANLLSNAIRHATERGHVTVRIDTEGSAVLVAVENSGAPIPGEHRARIFDRFYRADPARHRDGEGAGLGLAITRAIARAHGGDITVACGEGSVRFTLALPVGETGSPAGTATPTLGL